MAIITVSQLNRYVGFRLKEDQNLQGVLVRGEISNFKNHYASGHLYFTLRDQESGVKAVMFRSSAQRLKFVPKEGMQVIVAASASLYEKEGNFQLYVTDMQPEGAGAQAQALEELKKKLTAMGVFDQNLKQPLPEMPKVIGVVTSDSGAAVRDVENVLTRRYPLGIMRIYPCLVQGISASESIAKAIQVADQDGCDVIIVGRGGGAAEDLSAFNTEAVVMAIYRAHTPIISAVGHETDWSLSDAAADLRAPTPSAAAELAVPNMEELMQRVSFYENKLNRVIQERMEQKARLVERLQKKVQLQSPENRYLLAASRVESLENRLKQDMERVLERKYSILRQETLKLDALSPLKILDRGYAMVYQEEHLVKQAGDVAPGDELRICLAEGEIHARVE